MQESENFEETKEEPIAITEEGEQLINENNGEEEIETESKVLIGTFMEAPKFLQDNEYIAKGYLLNCNTFKKTFKSLFMCHNETVNIWTHLLGAIFFFFLIFFTSIFVSNYKSQLNKIKDDLSTTKQNVELLYDESPQIMNNTYYSMKEIIKVFDNINKKDFYQNALTIIFSLYNEIKDISSNIIDSVSSYFKETLDTIKDGVALIKEQILNLIKLDSSKSEYLEYELDNQFNTDLQKRKAIELARWPLFVIIHSAILLFLFSASFHSLKAINERYHDILSRFDYGGISLLIAGSCYPPYYYFFYYSNTFKYIYLVEITVFGLGTFLYSLTDDFNKPQKRTLRGIIFLILGLSTAIPILHMAFFGKKIDGYGPGLKLINWYLGGASYVIGALLYIIRFPEKKFPGKFDYVGASHQIFHVLVFFGALFHYIGSLDAYNYRFKNLKSNSVE